MSDLKWYSNMGCLKIVNERMRNAVVSTLSGNVETMKDMIISNHFSPIEIAHWSGERRGVNTNGTLNSYQLAQAMSDALQRDKLYLSLNVDAMWQLHKDLLPGIERTSYDQLGFVIWNWFDRPGDNPYFDEEEEKDLFTTGVPNRDICLTNYGIQHMENEVIELLKAGASPYFLVTAPSCTEMYVDKDGVPRHTYFDVAPMIEVSKMHSDDYWIEFIHDDLESDICSLPVQTLEEVVEGIFNVAACERILYLTDKFISDEARAKGEELMLKHLGEVYSILI